MHGPCPLGLGEIDGLHGTSTHSYALTWNLCTGKKFEVSSMPMKQEVIPRGRWLLAGIWPKQSQGFYLGFAYEKINNPAIPRP